MSSYTVGELISRTTRFFQDKGIEQARLDAEVLLGEILELERIQLYVRFDQPLEESEVARYREWIKIRAEGMPTAYILGKKEFMGYSFRVTPDVLIPRPDTEILVEAGLRYLEKIEEPHFLDICTGSGAILISLLKKMASAKGIGTDISAKALEIAKENAKSLDVNERSGFLQGNLLEPIGDRKVHGIFSNPPYIPTEDLKSLQREVQKEPMLALDGGIDGLDFYRRLLEQSENHLLPEGFLMMEVGIGQAEDICKIAEKTGWNKKEDPIFDYGGISRVVVFDRSR